MSALATPSTPRRRLSVPLTDRDEEELKVVRRSPARLSALIDVDARSSDAHLVHAVFEAGLEHLREAEEAAEYVALARDDEWADGERRRRDDAAPVFVRFERLSAFTGDFARVREAGNRLVIMIGGRSGAPFVLEAGADRRRL